MADRILYARFRWAGGEHRFALPMDFSHGVSFQRHGVDDPQPRLNRLLLNNNTVQDIATTIRGGLIGGGMKPGTAMDKLIVKHVMCRPLADGAVLAKAILLVAVFGIPAALGTVVMEPGEIVDQASGEHIKALEGAD